MPKPNQSLYLAKDSLDMIWGVDKDTSETVIRGVSEAKLLDFFWEDHPPFWRKVIILTHHHWMKSETFVEFLISIRDLNKLKTERTLRILQEWFTFCPFDFFGNTELKLVTNQLIDGFLHEEFRKLLNQTWLDSVTKYKNLIHTDYSAMHTNTNEEIPEENLPGSAKKRRRNVTSEVFSGLIGIGNNPTPSSGAPTNPALIFLSYDPTDIAQQLTLIDHRLFALIPSLELLRKNFTDPSTCPNLTKMSERFNQVTGWIGTLITGTPVLKMRRKILCHFIAIGVKLLVLRNFAGLMAVFLGLTQGPVSRMTQTWKSIPEEIEGKWQKLESLCSPGRNFKNLRAIHENCSTPSVKAPTLFVKDLTFIEDGNENFITEEIEINSVKKAVKFWNLVKIQQLGRVIESVHSSQITPYNIPCHPALLEYLSNVAYVDRNTLETYSRTNEPPNKDD
uniref:Ras-GEF domain-containing protein n=1 Tax=Arcella intermedia TaxID=1963864 RepID=A0A6B2L436_9EUKA